MIAGRLTDSPICDVGLRSPPAVSPATALSHSDAQIRVAEEREGAPITTATAIYALGALLSELLASNRPFCSKSDNDQQSVDAVLHEAPVRPWLDALIRLLGIAC